MLIYSETSYRAVIRKFVDSQTRSHGLLGQLADASGCQRTYFSRVLSGRAQLSMDQGFEVAKFMELTQDETDYFLLLIEYERAGRKLYRQHLKVKIESVQKKMSSIGGRLKSAVTLDGAGKELYYSSWIWSAVHMAAGLDGNCTLEEIAQKAQLPLQLTLEILEQLKNWQCCIYENGYWRISNGNIHMDHHSPALFPYHQSWRNKGMQYQLLKRDADLFYTSVQTLSKSDAIKVRDKLLEVIQQVRNIAVESPKNEEVVVFAADLFKL
ncbi:MAG: DUF4423 domain-containing protein [Proteobacteria bacterium]|nr:DUF4423 domain-containing protein [Pseudomonadota bacterium]